MFCLFLCFFCFLFLRLSCRENRCTCESPCLDDLHCCGRTEVHSIGRCQRREERCQLALDHTSDTITRLESGRADKGGKATNLDLRFEVVQDELVSVHGSTRLVREMVPSPPGFDVRAKRESRGDGARKPLVVVEGRLLRVVRLH